MKTILVQAGHLQPYEPGTEGQSGAAGELELNLRNRDALCRLLAKDGRFKPLPMPSAIPNGTKCDAAIFFHADGSGNKSVGGFSFGFPTGPGMGVNKQLAVLIANEYLKLDGHPSRHADNYTRDEAGYYGFRATATDGPEVLWEVGFVSNPSEKAWLYAHVDEIAGCAYRALLHYFGMTPKPPPKPTPAPKPQKLSGYWQVTKTFHDGQQASVAKTQSILFWALRNPRVAAKGIRDLRFHWIETAG